MPLSTPRREGEHGIETIAGSAYTGAGGEKHPEVQVERVWDDIVKKLFQKEYTFDAATYGSMNEYVKKIAYFYHASIQGAGPYPGAAETVRLIGEGTRLQQTLPQAGWSTWRLPSAAIWSCAIHVPAMILPPRARSPAPIR